MYLNTEEKFDSEELTGTFKILQKKYFCCEKLVNIYFVLTKDYLNFYLDKNQTKLYKKISRQLVIGINRRFRNENDKNKLSIYYLENENSNIIKEFKLKSENILKMEKWIKELNSKIQPMKHEFTNFSNNYIKSNDIFHFENQKYFYLALCNLEYILCRRDMENFFAYYKKKFANYPFDADEKLLMKNDGIK